MAKLKWDQAGDKYYETGIDHGILYPQKNGTYPEGFAWNGIISVSENPSGAEDNPLYADNIKYLNLKSNEEFGATLECYTYPDEWKQCNGEAELAEGVIVSGQRRNTFGLCYRTKIGNDTDGQDHGFKLHMVWGCSSAPSERSYETVNDSPDAITFSFELTSTPVPLSGKDANGKPYKPVSIITIDSRTVDKTKLQQLEDILYGTDAADGGTESSARLPMPDEVKAIFAAG